MSLEVENLSVTLGKRQILEQVSFLAEEPLTVILGKNGAGKTTLLKTIAGLYRINEGTIFIDGNKMTDLSERERARRISYAPQDCQAAGCQVLDFVVMGRNPYLKFWQMPGKKEYEDSREALKELGISHLEKRTMDALSGGERRLCYLARARVQEAEWMILDEPESGLDFGRRHEFFEQLKEYLKKNKKYAIISVHDPILADAYGDRILLMKKGQILASIHKNDRDYERQLASGLKRLYGPKACLIKDGNQRAVVWRGEKDADYSELCEGSQSGRGL